MVSPKPKVLWASAHGAPLKCLQISYKTHVDPTSPELKQEGIDADSIKKWVAEAQDGSEEAFAQIVRVFAPRLQVIIYRILLDWEESRDVTQETFIRAYRALARYKPEGNFQSWLFQIGVRQARDALRKRRRRITEFVFKKEDRPPEIAIIDNSVAQSELASTIEKAVKSLPESQRIVFTLSEYEGFGYREIAELIGGSTKSVERHLSRARMKLREMLKDYLM